MAVAALVVLAALGWSGYRLTRIDLTLPAGGVDSCYDAATSNPDGIRVATRSGLTIGLAVVVLHSLNRVTFVRATPVGVSGTLIVDREYLVPSGGSVGTSDDPKTLLSPIQQALAVYPGQSLYTVPPADRELGNESGKDWQLVVHLRTTAPVGLVSLRGFSIEFSAPWHWNRTFTAPGRIAIDGLNRCYGF
jgi:hypothetical protein